jgi:hypothetical protein
MVRLAQMDDEGKLGDQHAALAFRLKQLRPQ